MLNPLFNPFPEIQTSRLLLRKIVPADVKEVYFLRSNEEVMRYIDRPRAKDEADALAHIERITTLMEKNEGINWAITLKGSPVMIGNILLFNIQAEHARAELGYVLHTAHHRKGIMQEAVKAVIDYGFDRLQLHSMEAIVNPANVPSIKLLEKTGFVREGYLKENFFFNGTYLDTAIYSMLAPKK